MQAGGAASPSHVPRRPVHLSRRGGMAPCTAQLPAVCPDELTPTAVLSIRPSRTAGRKSAGILFSLEVWLEGSGVGGCKRASVHKRARGARSVTGHGLMKLVEYILLCWLGQVECLLSSLLTLPHNLDCT